MKITSNDKELSDLFIKKFSTKTSELIDYTNLDLMVIVKKMDPTKAKTLDLGCIYEIDVINHINKPRNTTS